MFHLSFTLSVPVLDFSISNTYNKEKAISAFANVNLEIGVFFY